MYADLSTTLSSFDNLSWDQQVQTLKYVAEILDDEHGASMVLDNIRQISIITATALSSLRSMVVRAGVSTLTGLFFRLGQSMDSELDIIMNPIVKKASDSGNRFLRDEAIELLNVISMTISPTSLCKSLLDYVLSKNDSIRKIMMDMIAKSLQKSASKIITNRQLVSKLVTTLSTLLGDKSATVRERARSSLLLIKDALEKVKSSKFSSRTLSSTVLSAIDVANNQSRNRQIRSAPQVRSTKMGPLQPVMTSRRPDAFCKISSDCSGEGLGSIIFDNVAYRPTTSPNIYNRKSEPELKTYKVPINDEGSTMRRTTICAIDGRMLKAQPVPSSPVPQFRPGSKSAQSPSRPPNYGYEQRVEGERKLAPRIFELSLLHSRIKPYKNDSELRHRRASEMFVAGRSAGESLVLEGDPGQRRRYIA